MVKLISSKSTGLISIIKIAQDSFDFSEGALEKYLGLPTLLRCPDNSIIPGMAEFNGGIDICGERLKTILKTLFSFF